MSERDKIVRWLNHRRTTGEFCIEGELELDEIIAAIEHGEHNEYIGIERAK